MKALSILAWLACLLSLCSTLLAIGVSLAMWPLVLLQSVGSFVVLAGAHLLSFAQLWAVIRRRFALSLSLFAIAFAGLLLSNLPLTERGPAVCAWGPQAGLLDCGLSAQRRT